MLWIYSFVGLLVGSLLDVASDCLPRWSTSRLLSRGAEAQGCRGESPLLLCSSGRGWLTLTRRDGPILVWSSLAGLATKLLTALLFAFLWIRYGPSFQLALATFYSCLFLLIALVDIRHRLVLNVILYPAVLLTLLRHLLLDGPGLGSGLLGSGVALGLFLLAALIGRGALGTGDVKLAGLIGLMAGFPAVLWALALGILADGLIALLLLLTRRQGLKSTMPYAPGLLLGAWLILVARGF